MSRREMEKVLVQVTLLFSVVKWACYASLVGTLAAGGTFIFLRALSWACGLAGQVPDYYLILPVALPLSSLLVLWLAPDAEGHGTEKVIEAVHKSMGRIPLKVVPVKLVATVITIAAGGSAGKEGPCAQIGAGLASAFSRLLRLDDHDRRKMVICGISAGFATVFGTPIAGAIFGIEVLVMGQMLYDVLFPSFVAGIVGYHVTSLLGIQYPLQQTRVIPPVSGGSLVEMLLLGVWCGVVALALIEALKLGGFLFRRMPGHRVTKAAIGGCLLVGITLMASSRYLGLGLDTIEAGLAGTKLPVSAFLWKGLTTAVTLSCGGSGGIVTPIFFIGTAAGNLFGQLFDPQYLGVLSAIGMVALLAAAANTPIAASVMAIELFGPAIAPHAAIACVVSFLMVGYRSVYPSQILGIMKSPSVVASMGYPMGDIPQPTVVPREHTLIGATMKGLDQLSARKRHRKKRK